MSRKKPTTGALIDETAQFARRLLKRASETRVSPQADGGEPTVATPAYDLETQAAVLSVVTRWVTTQHRIAPEEPDDSDFDRLRSKLGVGGKPGSSKAKRGTGGTAVEATNGLGQRISYGTNASDSPAPFDDNDETDD